ncbi:GEVED domain-containing protein [Lewinella sp. W8]|uniref:GEVED domain-containing protein n=1 Tax=Lewinella sp. W8 TaxID=2528208 RepID=UPI0010678804|nr:GEVED domain-containing protein [Lewinella sp. W8]MTB49431.1 T9SS type A sorting domain-containing protein [Lewinella sp. W8]
MNPRYRILFCALFSLLSASAFAQFPFIDLGPRAVCESAINVSLPATGCEATLTPDMLDAGSYSVFGSGLIDRWVSPEVVGPGTHTVQLFVRDFAGTRSCTTQVLVEDKIAPVVACSPNVVVTIDDPTTLPFAVSHLDVDEGSYDNCALIYYLALPSPNYWGAFPYTLQVLDGGGNSNSCSGYIETRSPYAPAGYCGTRANSTYEYIQSFGVISSDEVWEIPSGDNGGAIFFTGLRHFRAGDPVTFNYEPGFSWGSYREYWQIFLDTNRDGDFNDPGELLHRWNGTTGNTASVVLPASFPRYGFSRMRVVMSYGNYVNPCDADFWGEYEDYAVRLLAPGEPIPALTPEESYEDFTPELTAGSPERAGADKPEPMILLESATADLLPARNSYEEPQTSPAASFSAYPNPAAAGQEIRVRFPEVSLVTGDELVLMNLVGRRLATYSRQPNSRQQSITLPAELPAGIYLLNHRTSDGQMVAAQRILVR